MLDTRSAASYDSLFSFRSENIQWSVDTIVLSMPSTDLIGTKTDSLIVKSIVCLCATEDNSLCNSYQVVIADECDCLNASGLQSRTVVTVHALWEPDILRFHPHCCANRHATMFLHMYTPSPVTHFSSKYRTGERGDL